MKIRTPFATLMIAEVNDMVNLHGEEITIERLIAIADMIDPMHYRSMVAYGSYHRPVAHGQGPESYIRFTFSDTTWVDFDE